MCTTRAPELATDTLVPEAKCAPDDSADAITGQTARAATASRPATGESRNDFSIMNLPSMTWFDERSLTWFDERATALRAVSPSSGNSTLFAGFLTSAQPRGPLHRFGALCVHLLGAPAEMKTAKARSCPSHGGASLLCGVPARRLRCRGGSLAGSPKARGNRAKPDQPDARSAESV